LSAVYSFAESEISGLGIESMEMGEYVLVYCFSHNLLFVAAANKEDKASNLKMQVDYIKTSFLQEFPFVVKGGKEFWLNWNGEQGIFRKFNDILEDLITSWTDVKISTSIAEKMDKPSSCLKVSRIIFFLLPWRVFANFYVKRVFMG